MYNTSTTTNNRMKSLALTIVASFVITGCGEKHTDKAKSSTTIDGTGVSTTEKPDGLNLGGKAQPVAALTQEMVDTKKDGQKTSTEDPEVHFDEVYRRECTEWGRKFLFRDADEEVAFTLATKLNMHFAYLAFIEIYPQSKHAASAKTSLSEFRTYSPTIRSYRTGDVPDRVLTNETLKLTYGFNGNPCVYRCNNLLAVYSPSEDGARRDDYAVSLKCIDEVTGVRPTHLETGFVTAASGICYGNIQMVGMGFHLVKGGIRLNPYTYIIYRTPKKVDVKSTE
jgi:hypothetical protein